MIMRKIYSIFFLLLALSIQQMQAQTRYLNPVFTDVDVETDVMYGMNATVLYYSVIGQAVPEP